MENMAVVFSFSTIECPKFCRRWAQKNCRPHHPCL